MFKHFLNTRAAAALLCAALLLAIPVAAQTFYGSLVGTITDPSGAVVPSATVTLTNTATGVQQQVKSGPAGNYQFLNLIPGTYRVDVEASGFKKATHQNVQVTVSGTARADVNMEVGSENQTVEVQAAPPLLQTQEANLSQVVNNRMVEQLPVNGRNIMNLTAVTPGVVPQGTTGGNALTGKNIFAAGNYQVGGGFANQSATYIDGVAANSALGNLVNFVPNPSAVSEFRVQTSSNNAEYGRYSGGVISVTTKSGTNRFHGDAYEYFQNTVLNANNFFANRNGTGRRPTI